MHKIVSILVRYQSRQRICCKMAVNMWRKLLKPSLFLILIELLFVVAKRNVVQLSEDNWKEMLDQEWMVEL